MEDVLQIADKKINVRLFLGTGKYPNRLIPQIAEAAGIQVMTVAVRRANLKNTDENILSFIPEECILLPNTSGARTAEEVVRIARLARAAGCGSWVKIEAVADTRHLLPDNFETLKATEVLVKEGFTVLPYISPDLAAAKRLADAGAAAVMPLGAPIGTNRGLRTKELLQILIDEISLPVIVDAGIGKPSQAAEAMEMGAAAVLLNTAVSSAADPVRMASAFALAVKAGREAYLAGTGVVSNDAAAASSPLTGFLHD